MSHTPGPWHTFIDKRQGPLVSVYDCELVPDGNDFRVPFGAKLVAVACNIGHMPTTIDNAKLIAAAPDLLEALEDLLPLWQSGIEEPWVVKAKAAIAKARGQ